MNNDKDFDLEIENKKKELSARTHFFKSAVDMNSGNTHCANREQNRQREKEDWSTIKLLDKYKNLRNITLKNVPNLWPGLEFALSVKTILNIDGCTLPFAGIILGPASSLKTSIIELFRGCEHTFYTDNFSPKSLVSHNSAVKKDKLKEIDMLPKIKNKIFLTPELAPYTSGNSKSFRTFLNLTTMTLASGLKIKCR